MLLSEKEKLLVRKLRVYVSAHMPARLFYWCADDINAYETWTSKRTQVHGQSDLQNFSLMPRVKLVVWCHIL